MSALLHFLGIRGGSPLIILAAQVDLVVSAMALIGAVVLLVPVTVQVLVAALRGRWARARRFGIYWIMLFLLGIYCLASVLNGLDSLDLIPD